MNNSTDQSDAQLSGASPDAEVGLWRRVREKRDAQAREQLITHYLPYARIIAATYYARRMHDEIEFDEYLQLARLGMLESLDRYDPAAGAQFKTFAARRMHGAILDGLEQLTEKQRQISVRKQLQKDRIASLKAPADNGETLNKSNPDALLRHLADVGLGLALVFLLEDTGMVAHEHDARGVPDPHYQQLELRQLRRRVRELVDRLPDVERRVIRNHYLQNQPFDEIAGVLGLTKGRVSQIHKKAIGSLRQLVDVRRRCDVAF